MTVGESLAEARTRAGLSVDEISERTRIRASVILGIERDDYDACGGDLFLRGYVRVIADAIGIDAQPLIDEYDRTRPDGTAWFQVPSPPAVPAVPATPVVPAAPATPVVPAAPAPPVVPAAPATPAAEAPAETRVTRIDLPNGNLDDTADDIPRARLHDTVSDIDPVGADAPLPDNRSRRPGRRRTIGAGVLAVVIIGAGVGIALASGGGGKTPAAAGSNPAARNSTASAGRGAGAYARGQATVQASPAASQQAADSQPGTPAPGTSAPATPEPATPALAQALPVSLAEAFGPDGTSDGDNPQNAMNAVSPHASQPWTTDWYATAEFGGLQRGTGLLLDMGSTVTIAEVRVDLGPNPGSDVQLLAGNVPTLAGMRLAASADDAAGVTYFRPASPVTARYLLVWFTRLPPVDTGQFQASVYSVAVTGRS